MDTGLYVSFPQTDGNLLGGTAMLAYFPWCIRLFGLLVGFNNRRYPSTVLELRDPRRPGSAGVAGAAVRGRHRGGSAPSFQGSIPPWARHRDAEMGHLPFLCMTGSTVPSGLGPCRGGRVSAGRTSKGFRGQERRASGHRCCGSLGQSSPRSASLWVEVWVVGPLPPTALASHLPSVSDPAGCPFPLWTHGFSGAFLS